MNAPPAARRTARPVLPPTHGVPMQVGLLEQVMRLEVQAYPFPWSRGNFVDSIAAGYWSHCRITEEGLLIGYMVALRSLEEWRQHGIDHVLSKPIEFADLSRLIELMQQARP